VTHCKSNKGSSSPLAGGLPILADTLLLSSAGSIICLLKLGITDRTPLIFAAFRENLGSSDSTDAIPTSEIPFINLPFTAFNSRSKFFGNSLVLEITIKEPVLDFDLRSMAESTSKIESSRLITYFSQENNSAVNNASVMFFENLIILYIKINNYGRMGVV